MEESESKAPQANQQAYLWGKYHTKITGPEYTTEQYDAHLQSTDWSKEETDYLVELCLDYDLRWILIADRYDFQPKETRSDGDAMAITVTAKPRSMEDMKARYYDVSAKMMIIHHPLATMSSAEFDLYEKMTKFEPRREATRKQLAEALSARSYDEVKEEEILLGELKRIVSNEEKFLQERKELYARLDHPTAQGSVDMYKSSAGLVQLMQTLLSQDKIKKRRSLMGPGDAASPAQGPDSTRRHHPRCGPGAADFGRAKRRCTGPQRRRLGPCQP